MSEQAGSPKIVPTLGLVGATMNAMALIAPGAFLWISYQLQAAATAPGGASVASDIWPGIVAALAVAFLTALSYAELAKIYPEAGFASAAYFAEKAFIDSNGGKRTRGAVSAARISKLATGWAAHLFYWVYPGIMVAMFATMIGYLYTQFTGGTLSTPALVVIATAMAFGVAYVAYRGVTGSTMVSVWINVIQWVSLVGFSLLAIYYRIANPQNVTAWSFSGVLDVIKPHSLNGVLVQATIAILILVGFESCTALAAETKQPEKNIPRAIIIALVVQGLFAYLLGYLATGLMIGDKYTSIDATSKKILTGMDAAGASSAPLGDLAKLIGDNLLHGIGFGLMITIAVTVVIAIIGTTLSCMNTAVRISNGLAEDRELPEFIGFMSGKFSTPHTAIWTLAIVSSIIAAIGVQSVVGLTGITLASNFGTFTLYGLICVWTIVAFRKREDFNFLKHGLIPALGVATNVIMLVAIIYLYAIGNQDAQTEAKICFYIAGGWALISIGYIIMTSVSKTYGMKMISAVIRPEKLSILVDVLKDEDLIVGMTTTRVEGFGRQKGHAADGNDTVTFLPKIRVEIVVNDWDLPKVMEIIREVSSSGHIGDGKIFVLDAREAMRLRTGERGVYAL